MTKRRAIYGTSATSISLARCCPEAQLLFDRLIAHADDQGRLQGDPMLVKASCMPLIDRATIKAVDRWLGELAEQGMIQRYEAKGQPLIQIVTWWEHQDWMRHIYPSRWAAPEGWTDQLKGSGMPPNDGAMPAPRPRDAGEVPPNDGATPAQSGVSGGGEDVFVIETNTSRGEDAREATPPLSDLSLRRITGTHFDLTRERPNDKAVEMYGDLIEKFGEQAVRDAQYRLGPQKGYGFVARVKAECKRVAA
ncbi:MAG: hypothetical protein LC798_19815 [Chloroflexi bacterium]|nr:hypothetical protein [Chloroflexota bacterium]